MASSDTDWMTESPRSISNLEAMYDELHKRDVLIFDILRLLCDRDRRPFQEEYAELYERAELLCHTSNWKWTNP